MALFYGSVYFMVVLMFYTLEVLHVTLHLCQYMCEFKVLSLLG